MSSVPVRSEAETVSGKVGAFVCTMVRPWREEDRKPALHPDATRVGGQEDGWPGGDYVTYECPHCLTIFSVELAQ